MRILGVTASSILKVTGSYESIATVNGTGSSGTITFSSIPSTYKHLQIRTLANDNSGNALYMQLNSDTGSNYTNHRLQGNGATTAAAGAGSQTENFWVGYASYVASNYGVSIVDLHDYSSTSKYKTMRSLIGYDINGGGLILLGSGLWMSTSAITSISIVSSGGNFTTASAFSLYGING